MPAAPKAAPAAAPVPAPDPTQNVVAPPLKIGTAIAHRIAAGAGPKTSGTTLLDSVLVVGTLGLLGYGLYGLMTFQHIPQASLPIVSSILSFLSGSILGCYAGYRWGASDTMKKAANDNGGAAK